MEFVILVLKSIRAAFGKIELSHAYKQHSYGILVAPPGPILQGFLIIGKDIRSLYVGIREIYFLNSMSMSSTFENSQKPSQ